MALDLYQSKRNFKKTSEPKGKERKTVSKLLFVVQKHDASHLHYDFRLELDGVLKSWAIPKGPSLDPEDKRLAVEVEDHPFEYRNFEGHIPKGNYGAGDVIVWDTGVYHSPDAKTQKENYEMLMKGYKKGHLQFVLEGKKLKGSYDLFRIKDGKNWLLVKKHDEYASTENILVKKDSVLSAKKLPSPKKGKDPMPYHIKPMLATLTEKPFDDKDWIFEIKWDGYRAIAEVKDGKVELYSRNYLNFKERYSAVTEALEKLGHDVVLDGEVVVLDRKGISKFQLLQKYTEEGGNLTYQVFDILYLDGTDLRKYPLIERKKLLELLLPKKGILKYSGHIEEKGASMYTEAQKAGLEGVMAKNKNSAYIPQRSEQWLKLKTEKRQEAIICGFTEPQGTREHFGSLILGVYVDNKLTFVGHTGSGFDGKKLRSLHTLLLRLKTKDSPFERKPKTNMPVTWVKPELLCEVKFSEWTDDGIMRHPIFMGLREDKDPKLVKKEIPQKTSHEEKTVQGKVELTNPKKVYWPELGLTKKDLFSYYEKIADTILPYLKDRPESLNRHPNGIHGTNFYQKNTTYDLPDFIETTTIYSESAEKNIHYILCQNKETLLYMANLGCIEINPWNSRVGKLEYPDYMVIDLDPGENTIKELVQVAQVVHEILDMACEKSYVKTSGKTGLHIFVPLRGKYHYGQVRIFSEYIATLVHKALPDITSIERSPSKRKDKIYIDFLQNRIGQTLAAPYCLRPVKEATVSTPLLWEEVNDKLDLTNFTMDVIFKRLKKYGDLWESLPNETVDLKKSITCLENALKSK
ncbi:MAG: DNA ligase D [Candidatus Gracilibacteria bacterium]